MANSKPRLTAKTVDLLRGLAGYAESESDLLISEGDDDQKAEGERIQEAVDWVRRLCEWHDETHKAKP